MSLDLEKPLPPEHRRNGGDEAALEELQANILKPHGRPHAAHLLVRFASAQVQPVRTFVKKIERLVTSAAQQLREAAEFSRSGTSGDTVVGFWLSRSGFRKLEARETPDDPAFQLDGMAGRRRELSDPDPDSAQRDDRLNSLDALVLVADQTKESVEEFIETRIRQLFVQNVIELVHLQWGTVLHNETGQTIEPFGFSELGTNPLLIDEQEMWRANDPASLFFPLKQVLVRFPMNEEAAYGTYFVFRKLEQNVKRFREVEKNMALALTGNASGADSAAAMLLGRYRNGTSLLIHSKQAEHTGVPDNFSYRDFDYAGLICPLHAHIRKANPRGDIADRQGISSWRERDFLIVRRGIPYDDRTHSHAGVEDANQFPEQDVGTLFISCQASIATQFEHIQKYWINGFGDATRQDPLAGQLEPVEQEWPVRGPVALSSVGFRVERCVRLKGGEYFFAPPKSFLRKPAPST